MPKTVLPKHRHYKIQYGKSKQNGGQNESLSLKQCIKFEGVVVHTYDLTLGIGG